MTPEKEIARSTVAIMNRLYSMGNVQELFQEFLKEEDLIHDNEAYNQLTKWEIIQSYPYLNDKYQNKFDQFLYEKIFESDYLEKGINNNE